jgi:hypothetical protein
MSYDLALWNSGNATPSDSEAGRLYIELCEDQCGGGPVAAGIQELYTELTRRYPEIDNVPEEAVDDCPWSGLLNRSGHHVILNVVWSRAEEIRRFVFELAKKHNLVLFDPQRRKVLWPTTEPPKRWFRFW